MKFDIIECPRDAMQGIKTFIPTEMKIQYIKELLSVGFKALDCGSFVNPSAVPQMSDTAEVIRAISDFESQTKLLVIVANVRGAIRASAFEKISYLGYPFSVSSTFQKKNTNSTIEEAFITLRKINEIAKVSGKEVVSYISMGFGNPYEDPYSYEMVLQWIERLSTENIKTISLADTTSQANAAQIAELFSLCKNQFPEIEFGVHLHAPSYDWEDKVRAAIDAGCRRIDSAILGFGGCPFAKDHLVGNIPTEGLLRIIKEEYSDLGYSISPRLMALANKTYTAT
jgi:hydroxymethylglutaryl-CoA lyase